VGAAVYDWLLFLHVLSAFLLLGTIVVYSAFVLGAPAAGRTVTVANVMDGVGGAGTIVFGIVLALHIDEYKLWDGWILGAIVLWAVAAELSRRAQGELRDPTGKLAQWHWLRTIAVVGILVLMVWKPGA
jgi:hypothetical protein